MRRHITAELNDWQTCEEEEEVEEEERRKTVVAQHQYPFSLNLDTCSAMRKGEANLHFRESFLLLRGSSVQSCSSLGVLLSWPAGVICALRVAEMLSL